MKARKILVSLAALALVAAISIGGTLAYLTSTKSVKNTFTVGNVTIKLDETKTKTDGTPVEPADRTEEGNQYKLIPGGTYTKDPTVTVLPGSEESYVRLIVKISDVTAAVAAFGDDYDLSNIFKGFNDNNWSRYGQVQKSEDGKTLTYEYRYATTVTPTSGPERNGVLEPLFTSVQIPGTLTDAQYAALNNLNIEITAEAVQAAGFNGDADAAWRGFANQQK